MTTTPRGSRVGLAFAQLLSTFIICVGLASLASTPPSSEGAFDAAAFAWNVAADPSGGGQWRSGAIETDPPDSDDDNDDDDGPDSSDSVVLPVPRAVTINLQTYPPFDLQFTSPLSSVARDGHSLRAPPR